MLGEFISRGLFMILGYAYPAFECFKTVEKNKVDIRELRFWCQYWIIVAVLSVCERFGDVFISWVPLYGELKLAFIIYLWYPKTKGTSYVYENMLRPFVWRHETDIEKNLRELRLRAWDLAIYYYQNCTELGQSAFFNVIQYIGNQSSTLKGVTNEKGDQNKKPRGPSILRHRHSTTDSTVAQPAPSAPPLPANFPSLFKAQAQASKSNVVQTELDDAQTEYVHFGEFPEQEDASPSPGSSPIKERNKPSFAWLRLRRSKPVQ